VSILKVTDEKSRIRIRIRLSEVRIRGSGSVPKCHGSATLQCEGLNFHMTLTAPYQALVAIQSRKRCFFLVPPPVKFAWTGTHADRESVGGVDAKKSFPPHLIQLQLMLCLLICFVSFLLFPLFLIPYRLMYRSPVPIPVSFVYKRALTFTYLNFLYSFQESVTHWRKRKRMASEILGKDILFYSSYKNSSHSSLMKSHAYISDLFVIFFFRQHPGVLAQA
jgi:hypothetical protein